MASQATQTARTPTHAPSARQTGILQRKCACGQHTVAGGECESCRKKRGNGLQRAADKTAASINGVPSLVYDVLRSPGQPLDPETRALMEPRFGGDFSGVRVHADSRAAASARTVNALAYTVGDHIVFGGAQYAPHTASGSRLMAHELTHVVQQRMGGVGPQHAKAVSHPTDAAEVEAETTAHRVLRGDSVQVRQPASALVQGLSLGEGIGIGVGVAAGAAALGLGIAALAGAFDKSEFSDEELRVYLNHLARSQQIEDHTDSDNKARDIVRRWKRGQSGYAVLTVPIRTLLIQEMASGYLSGDDQHAILDLLSDSIPSELEYILPKIDIEALKTRFDGENRTRLDALLSAQETDLLGLSDEWSAQGVMQILNRHGDQRIVQTIVDQGYKIFRFTTAFDKWRYADGREEEDELTGLRGNTRRDRKEIRLRKNLTNEVASSTLFHEVSHVVSTETDYLEQEIQVRVETEQFHLRHGLPPMQPEYRRADGTVNEPFIRQQITASPHYNPSGRTRIGRRYVGEHEVIGWHVP